MEEWRVRGVEVREALHWTLAALVVGPEVQQALQVWSVSVHVWRCGDLPPAANPRH